MNRFRIRLPLFGVQIPNDFHVPVVNSVGPVPFVPLFSHRDLALDYARSYPSAIAVELPTANDALAFLATPSNHPDFKPFEFNVLLDLPCLSEIARHSIGKIDFVKALQALAATRGESP